MKNQKALDKAISKLEKLWIAKNNEVHDWHINRSKPNSKPIDMEQSRNFGRMVGELKAYRKALKILKTYDIEVFKKDQ